MVFFCVQFKLGNGSLYNEHPIIQAQRVERISRHIQQWKNNFPLFVCLKRTKRGKLFFTVQ